MGNTLSSIHTAFKAFLAAAAAFYHLSKDFNEILTRTQASPGIPTPHPTESYWEQNPPFPDLKDIASEPFPQEADVLIVGSGITAGAVARSLLDEISHTRRWKLEDKLPSVVVCESRTICGGATGRNGGHIKASPHELFGRFRKKIGPERAATLVRFSLRHVEVLTELCKKEGIDVAECREVETADVFLDLDTWRSALEEVEELKQWVPEYEIGIWGGAEAQERFGVNHHVVGALSFKAGALWPYRLVTWIWNKLLRDFPGVLSIQTHCPVLSIHPSNSAAYPYKVITPRGTILAKHIVHTTNAFASHLIPGIRGKAFGVLAQMSSQRPGLNFPGNGDKSWSIMYNGGFDYITQRPLHDGKPGDLMVGDGFNKSAKQGMDNIAVYDDGQMDPLVNAHILGTMQAIFRPKWGRGVEGSDSMCWSGIIGVSADGMPLVGRISRELTGRKVDKTGGMDNLNAGRGAPAGEWMSAIYNGDGMCWAWLCGTAVGIMIAGTEDDVRLPAPGRPAGRLGDWFPEEELCPSVERVRKMDVGELAEELMS
ncbi:hypothetical protein HDV00_002226 [Rhizophlyctis rosea]|nr:hypothetical protein HDV00_002226 [Rhizophlyctis rosea]